MKRILLYIIINLTFTFTARSQADNNHAMTWDEFVNIMADETDDDTGPDSQLFEDLLEIHTHPMNLNNISEEDLVQLPFLSEDDIKNIIFYIENHKPIMSTGELMFVYSLNRQKRLMMQLFCYAGEYDKKDFSFKNLFKYSNSELTIRSDFPFNKKVGYKDVNDSILGSNPNKVYKGNNLYHSLRFCFTSQKHIFAGFQMEKDPGENYIDHFAGYAMVKNIGCLNTAIVGNYRISFGHGLAVNTGSSFGKAMKLGSMDRITRGITKQSSTSESGFFTGGAATLQFGKIKTSLYFSQRKGDGTYNSDSTGLSSLKTDGLHRTKLEISKKNNTTITDFGGNIHFDFNSLQLSATAAFTSFNIPLKPKFNTESSLYKKYDPAGYDFAAYSFAYSYRYKKLIFSGETALNSKLAIATLNHLQWTPNSLNTFTVIQRYYGAKYHAINANAFGDNSIVHNENGIYVGWNSEMTEKVNIKTYVDAVYYPWLKYQVHNSSYGLEGLCQLTYSPNSNNSITLRYRIKSGQKDFKSETGTETESRAGTGTESGSTAYSILKFKSNHNLRLLYDLSLSSKFSLRTSINGTYISFANTNSKGFGIGESIRYNDNKRIRLDFSTIFFNTDSYDSRIYNYESSLLYTFAMTSYYYKGIRLTLLASWKILEKLSLTAKFGSTIYFNKGNIGSGLEEIKSNHKEDLQLQLRWKF